MEYEVGTVLEGKVTSITKFGAFVALEGGKSGLVHISEIANSYVNDVHDFLQEGQGVPLIEGVFELLYVKNPGAAFSILENKRVFFILLTVAVMGFLLLVILSGRYRRHMLLNISFVLVLAGGIGNLIDRVRLGYVVDMLDTMFMDFPVFNVADVFVVCGTVCALIYYLAFYSKSDEKNWGNKVDGTDPAANK